MSSTFIHAAPKISAHQVTICVVLSVRAIVIIALCGDGACQRVCVSNEMSIEVVDILLFLGCRYYSYSIGGLLRSLFVCCVVYFGNTVQDRPIMYPRLGFDLGSHYLALEFRQTVADRAKLCTERY